MDDLVLIILYICGSDEVNPNILANNPIKIKKFIIDNEKKYLNNFINTFRKYVGVGNVLRNYLYNNHYT
mgnify:FL=1